MIYYCEKCDVYFPEEQLLEIKPDGGIFHEECKDSEINSMTDNEILEELNNAR